MRPHSSFRVQRLSWLKTTFKTVHRFEGCTSMLVQLSNCTASVPACKTYETSLPNSSLHSLTQCPRVGSLNVYFIFSADKLLFMLLLNSILKCRGCDGGTYAVVWYIWIRVYLYLRIMVHGRPYHATLCSCSSRERASGMIGWLGRQSRCGKWIRSTVLNRSM